MDDLSRRLRKLGDAVAEVSDRGADRAAIDRARRRFVSPGVPPALRGRLVPVLLAAAFAVAVAAILWIRRAPPAVSFAIGSPPAPAAVGDWVAAGAEAPLEARFSEGSVLTLAPGARMRVTTTNPSGADVLIERGSVHAIVAHAGRAARWSLRAGPFEVRVTGTIFDAAWDPMTETFELRMQEGAVVVTGPLLPPDRSLIAGERLVVSVREGRMQLQAGAAAPSSSVSMGPQAASVSMGPQAAPNPAPAAPGLIATGHVAVERVEAEPSKTANVHAEPHPAAGSGWRELAAARRYREALAAADAAGFAQELERAPAGDLLALADAARFAGRPAQAREALLAVRRRFGARGHTAFLLGKIAADQQGARIDAVQWFEVYLAEAPGGPLAEQALGRIIELQRRSDPAAAARAATRYLARYPDGAYAALARSVVPP
jgi:hypothetical protein